MFLLIAVLINFSDLPKWESVASEPWQPLSVATVSAICFAFATPILWRGSRFQKVWASVLCPFPALIFISMLIQS